MGSAWGAEVQRPLLLLFETSKGEGAEQELVPMATQAVKIYYRDSKRVEPTIFDREMPTVKRAVMEKRLTADQVASYSTKAERLEVARALAFGYAGGSEVTFKDNLIEIKLWVSQAGGKNMAWEASGQAIATGTSQNDLENAIQCAASAAVIQMVSKAFAELPAIPDREPLSGDETRVIAVEPQRAVSAADYSSKADESLEAGNLAVAIQQYSQAVSTDPSNVGLRIKLAEAYARKGVFDKAYDELGRASLIGASAEAVAASKARIQDMENGKSAAPVSGSAAQKTVSGESASIVVSSSTPAAQATSGNDASAVTRMIEGDKLWNQGKPDEAAVAYKQATLLDPMDWRTYERLAVITVSMGTFNDSRAALEALAKVQPEPAPDVLNNRYDLLRTAFDKHFTTLLNQYDSESANFSKHIINRESYYSIIKGMALKLEGMAKFLDAIQVPPLKEKANLRRNIACGLMAQSAANMLEYLETNEESTKSNANTFATQAKKEIEESAKLEANTVVVTQ